MERWRAWLDRAVAVARRVTERLWAVARDPLRILPVVAVIALLAIAVPLTVTGLTRVGRSAMEWRHRSAIEWHHASATVVRAKIDDGLVLDLTYRDRHGDRNRVQTFVGDASGKWVGRRVPIRYNAGDHQSVELVGYGSNDPIPTLLLAGAPLGAGIAGIVLAISLFRRRALLAVSARPLQAMRVPLVAAACLVVAGLAAWAVGTVWERGWSAVASATGHLAATIFGDLLGVLVPLVAFALGCLVTAWLAKHRHHDEHDGLLSSAYRMIDRAAGMAPSPEEMRPDAAPAEETPVS
jgi:hypothetical protein